VERGQLKVGCAKYKTVLISGMDTIRSSTLKLLDQFVDAGGQVIIAGECPKFVNAVSSSEVEHLNFQHVSFTKDAILTSVPQPLATVSAPDIFGQLRKTDEGLIFAALNINSEERRQNAVVRIQTDLDIEEWNCETGEHFPVVAESSKGWKIFNTDFPIGGQKLWVASGDATSSLLSHCSQHSECVASTINGPFDYTLSEPNICVLDSAQYKFGNGEWQPESDVLKVDRMIRDAHGVMHRGGEMCQPWFTAQHPVKELDNVELRYAFEIETMPEGIDLVIEEPENFTVEMNGQKLDVSGAQQWIDIAFHRIRIPLELLVYGKNSIVLKTVYKESSNLEAIYLLGDFGVQLDGTVRRIVPKVGKIEIGDLCLQGFPFYSGAVTYHLPLPTGASRLRLPSIGGACAKVNGQMLGWDPFEADVDACDGAVDVEVILSRRNTFGPLHDAVKVRRHNGPDHWMTEGSEYTSECVFVPSGLLAGALVMKKKR
jgi:hypothetical protein